MTAKLSRCQGSNLLNYLQQKNLSVEVEQYKFLSPRDLEVEEERGNVVMEENVNLIGNPDYVAQIKFTEFGFNVNYIHQYQQKMANLPLWRTKLTFQGKTVYALEATKKKSLRLAVSMIDSYIREFLGV